jgi:hypothetical protein
MGLMQTAAHQGFPQRPSGESKPYFGCIVAELPNRNLTGIAFDDTSQVGLVNVPAGDRLLKNIYRQKLLS